MTIIDIQDMSFKYKDEYVLQDLTLQEEKPMIIGLWGRNGSGKTTLMKLMSGQERQNSGQISILNLNPYNNAAATKQITYLRENHFFGKTWNVNDAMKFASMFNDNWNQEEADYLIDLFELPRKKKIKTFSKGMHSMVQSVIGLASHAPVTMLDEPTNGLDAYMRKIFMKALRDSFEEDPRYIMISSHHIKEIEKICEKLIVISGHQVKLHEPIEYFQSRGAILVGKLENIQQIVSGDDIIEESIIMNQHKVMADIPFDDRLIEQCRDLKIKVDKASIQDYLVNITMTKEANHG
ncbi:ABC transporter ATP-binding protein [Mammaliicoccus vitulinus]|uniref:ABC transporter ATP-binding protein n=1 Tax=Mammaliicoccus vitulinus TaxID=71237 RepID=A0A2T4PR22_9STAP|nr:ABC transporter ATP-binding protein [Mammaliicoccus vitulinus]MBO3078345.1 ABC transporter ATP-binding protein [Mammaliicoccus vitulinus]PNZ40308.1 ABC transporter ATP-binding protein [Mammaliicoccus vitulinus]PTI28449.1 ABC transporter ATP-binding protein [Mammaliicoccus vitulinus]PTI70150.1 ABC transporter ATP-binding protein [Mammaliicoccus vitulinus]QRO85645.1 ABC transporter ATP-binding protein [Mammaliicoccus vitulinus]